MDINTVINKQNEGKKELKLNRYFMTLKTYTQLGTKIETKKRVKGTAQLTLDIDIDIDHTYTLFI